MIPEHYAREYRRRLRTLIESLLPVVVQDPAERFGGPLGTTFLVAILERAASQGRVVVTHDVEFRAVRFAMR